MSDNNKKIEKKVEQAFSNAAPDIFNSISSDCGEQKGTVIYMNEKKKRNKIILSAVSAAAVVILLFGSVFGVYLSNFKINTKVSLDVNPSVEMQLNSKDKVLDVKPLNEDGTKIIGDMDLDGSPLNVAVNAIIGSMLRNGYLTDDANSILISVDNSDKSKCDSLLKMLTDEINEVIGNNSFSGAILGQTILHDDNTDALAEKYGISQGKAQLINQITKQNTFYSFEDLVGLTVNELNLISESGNLTLDNVAASGTASDKAYIGEAKAKEIALSKAGAAEKDVSALKIELDWENGIMIYDVEFDFNSYEYDFNINAETGEIIKSEKEPEIGSAGTGNNATGNTNTNSGTNNGGSNSGGEAGNNNNNNGNTSSGNSNNGGGNTGSTEQTTAKPANGNSYIGEAKAKEIALNHAGVTASQIRDYECKLDRENGTVVYEVSFETNQYEYEYDINAATGKIIKSDKETNDDYRRSTNAQTTSKTEPTTRTPAPAPAPTTSAPSSSGGYIGEAKAKEAALNHAGVDASKIYGYECELEREHGLVVYEISFNFGYYEYEYDINAVTGAIVKYDKDIDD